MADGTTLFASEEDLAIWETTDIRLLCPRDQVYASGSDGAFASGDSWTLRVVGLDFAGRGVASGHLVVLSGPPSRFDVAGEAFVVDAAGDGWLRLRRKGMNGGEGEPPGTSSDLEHVEYAVLTLRPQLADASEWVARRIGATGVGVGRGVDDLEDVESLRDLTACATLERLYGSLMREGGSRPDVFASKAERYREQLDEGLARLVVWWRGSNDSTTRFHTRISR